MAEVPYQYRSATARTSDEKMPSTIMRRSVVACPRGPGTTRGTAGASVGGAGRASGVGEGGGVPPIPCTAPGGERSILPSRRAHSVGAGRPVHRHAARRSAQRRRGERWRSDDPGPNDRNRALGRLCRGLPPGHAARAIARFTEGDRLAEPGPAEGPRVLLVDDDAGNLALLRETLEAEGLAVVGEATDGSSGVELAGIL